MQLSTFYLKPVQTGFPGDSDARLVAAAASLPLVAGPHAAELDSQGLAGGGGASSSSGRGELSKTLYAWQQAVSPHLAVQREGRPVSDRQVAAAVAAELRAFAAADSGARGGAQKIAIVETAGGVASPGPSGSLQASAAVDA
jgi:dethiobiotin synthetase/adenosylmethionine--8-amino-7-oxononanoate aminotransferase